MSHAIGTTIPFEQLAVSLVGKAADLFGEATILGDRRTWWIDSISLDIDGGAPLRLKPGTELFETVRVALHRQCGPAIDDRMNRAVEEQGGYAVLFREAMPRDRFERGMTRLNAPSRVFELAA